MADLSLKGLDEGLMRAVKLKSAEMGLTQREWVVEVLGVAVGYGKEDGKVGKYQAPSKVSPKVVNDREEIAEFIAASPIVVNRDHDPKSCRVHRCGMCAVAGVKDLQRGLK
jgi:hypothetical protein